mmetsp:Transcript_8237/g.16620  ORF Transcript_8237/g.16620 Transcript_8237/m.16620 type:complete len:732 (-) Transcript_8237:45-2240(-)|eukprot:CAMPEP_0118642330 /NCGR_PEP_ID=MMETSP0785-20121206/5778_1 /TAXON_ID=91992 /ORGANISM="Bolidomonas pacifica, Strain CCMP 1866" /LENGTH=731 /DNA_ID=CAMNT_0006533875 /DNA_START=88 /DNA_END=2283 /DNA_ORIENTATION=-
MANAASPATSPAPSNYVSNLLASLSHNELLETLENAEAAAEAKKTELSLVVGTRYPSLLAAADSCEELLNLSKSIGTTLDSLSPLLASLNSHPAPPPVPAAVEPDAVTELGSLVGVVTCDFNLKNVVSSYLRGMEIISSPPPPPSPPLPPLLKSILLSQLPSILQKIDEQLQSPNANSPLDEIVSCKWKLRETNTGEKELLQWYESERKIGLSKMLSSSNSASPPDPSAILSYVETTTKNMVELFGGKLKSTCEGYRVPRDPRILVKRNTTFLSSVQPIIVGATSDIFINLNMENLTAIKTSLDLPATPEVNWRELQTSNYFTYLFGSTYEDSVEKFIVKNIISTIDSVLDEDYSTLEKIESIGEGGRGAVLAVIGVVITNLMEGGLPGARSILSLNSFVSSSSPLREVLRASVGPVTGIDLKGFESAHSIGGDSTGNIRASSLTDILSLPSAPAHFKLIPRLLSHIPLPLATLLCATYLNLRDIDTIEDLINVVVRESVDSVVDNFLSSSSSPGSSPPSQLAFLRSPDSDFRPPSTRLLNLLMSTATTLIKNTTLADLLFTATSPSSYNLTKVLRMRCVHHIEVSVANMYLNENDPEGEDNALQYFIDISFYKFCNPKLPPQLAARLEQMKKKADPMAIELANVDVNVPAIYHSHSALLNALFNPSTSQTSTTHNQLPPSNSMFETKAKFKPFAVLSEEEEEEEERRRKRAKQSVEKKETWGVSNLWGGL